VPHVICAGLSIFLIPFLVHLVGRVSRSADAYAQARLSPWLANFGEYCRHAHAEGFRTLKTDEDMTAYIRDVERQREALLAPGRVSPFPSPFAPS
jgi:hypothetical protein